MDKSSWHRPSEAMHGKQTSCPKCELEFKTMLAPFCLHHECPVRDWERAQDALKARAETPQPEWVVHVIGPDDVHAHPDELTALREANALNKALVQRRSSDPSPNDPFCMALVKDRTTEQV